MFKIKYILLPAVMLSCNMDGGAFTREQKTKIRKIVVNKQNKKLKRSIETAKNNADNESLLSIIIKGKNKIVSKAGKTEQFLKDLKGIFKPYGPASHTPILN
ncbi:hypothetical protein [Borreliella kurtenbachii]|uniref:hypothetical protein n=1 Tax=Borreliella kurtenbachii TaxID=1196056 RepID=UPI0026596001|nr:hypothetical protein [Borreliella kurtenbachii]WKC86748.1 hypothetical protein QIA22_00385 [Borreliella kurtenbachii]